MNTLTFVSSADLPDPIAPLAKTDLGSRVVKIFLAREGDTITVAGTDYPTVAEITSAISASDIVAIDGVANGKRVLISRTEFTGDDTETGGIEVYDRIMGVEGNIIRFDAVTQLALEKIDKHSKVRMWFVTEKGYLFGGVTGYQSSAVIDPILIEGFGTQSKIPFQFQYFHNGRDSFNLDTGYLAL